MQATIAAIIVPAAAVILAWVVIVQPMLSATLRTIGG